MPKTRMNHLLLFPLLLLIASPARADVSRSLTVDLDGDGRTEKVSLLVKDGGQYTLSVDAASVHGLFEGYEDPRKVELELADVDRADNLQQVKLSYISSIDSLLSDAEHYYWYEKGRLTKILEVPTQVESAVLLGNGIVHITRSATFWRKRDKYLFNKSLLKLETVEQPFYYVGVEGKTEASFPVFLERKASAEKVASLRSNSEIQVLVSDGRGWYLVKTSTDLVGWAREADLEKTFAQKIKDLHYSP